MTLALIEDEHGAAVLADGTGPLIIAMPDEPLYFEPDPAGPYTAEWGTSTPDADVVSFAIPSVLRAVPTLEATHTWDGHLQLHDHRELGDVRWRLRCRKISRGTMPTLTLPADPRVGGVGTAGRPGSVGGRSIVYSGAIEAVDAAALREATDELLAIGWQVDGDRPVMIDQNDAGWIYTGRALPDVQDNTSLPITAVPTPYQAEFTVAVQMNDPRIYANGAVTDLAVVAMPGDPNAGGLPWPSLPVVIRPEPAKTATGTVVITGRIATPILLRAHGPFSGLRITDLDRDLVLLIDAELDGGDWIDIDLRARAVTTRAGDDITSAIRWPDSTWWRLRHAPTPPGPLRLQLDADQVRAPARIDVIHHPAFP